MLLKFKNNLPAQNDAISKHVQLISQYHGIEIENLYQSRFVNELYAAIIE